MGRSIGEGENPVGEKIFQSAVSRVPPDTWNPVGRWGDHPPSLNTTRWPIVKKYCEGKVKSTPGGEWKRTWNLVFTSTESPSTDNRVPFVEWSGEWMYVARSESEMGVRSHMYSTRNRVTYPWPGWSKGKTLWRTEPTLVEMIADELWVAEKFQSNSEIAGSLRNSFRASLEIDYRR